MQLRHIIHMITLAEVMNCKYNHVGPCEYLLNETSTGRTNERQIARSAEENDAAKVFPSST